MELAIKDKKIAVYGNKKEDVPIVYLNTVHGEGNLIWESCLREGCPAFVLAAISGLDWDSDMSPWAIPPIAPGDTACSGGAAEYLKLLTEEIIPAVESMSGIRPRFRVIAGYSLAGLFAVYSAFYTDMFSRIASASGSLWFPGFYDFVSSHEMRASVSYVYLSLGNSESRTDNKFLSPVLENTEKIAACLKARGKNVFFELNPGNHFNNPDGRMAKGIARALKEPGEQSE